MRRAAFVILPTLIIILFGLLGITSGTPASAQKTAPTATEPPIVDIKPGDKLGSVPTDLDPLLVTLSESIVAWQAANTQTLGRYVQVLTAYSNPPVDGIAALPDLTQAKPTNEISKAADVWSMVKWPSALPAALWVDVYDGPCGKGFVVQVLTKFSGALWAKTFNTGCERYRDSGWQQQAASP